MARYISPFLSLVIYTKPANTTPPLDDTNPVALATFYNGELIVGDPKTGTGAGNDVDWSLAWDIYPGGANDKEKAGLGKIFFEAPYIDASGSLTSGKVYKVLIGSITHDGIVYEEGSTFEATGTSFTDNLTDGTSYVALAMDVRNFPLSFDPATIYDQDLSPWYIVNQLGFTDASRKLYNWDQGNWTGQVVPGVNPWFVTR